MKARPEFNYDIRHGPTDDYAPWEVSPPPRGSDSQHEQRWLMHEHVQRMFNSAPLRRQIAYLIRGAVVWFCVMLLFDGLADYGPRDATCMMGAPPRKKAAGGGWGGGLSELKKASNVRFW